MFNGGAFPRGRSSREPAVAVRPIFETKGQGAIKTVKGTFDCTHFAERPTTLDISCRAGYTKAEIEMPSNDVYSYMRCSISISMTEDYFKGAQTLRRSESSCPLLKIHLFTLGPLFFPLVRGGTDKTNPSALPNSRRASRNVKYS